MVEPETSYILAVDFGSTILAVKIYNKDDVVASTSVKVPYVYPCHGAVEVDPEALWDLFVNTVKTIFTTSGISPSSIRAFGFCSQRGACLLWDKKTGKPSCNIITWQDTRCGGVVDQLNHSWMLKGINAVGAILYTIFRHKKFMLMKALHFADNQCSMKLCWLLKMHPELQRAADDHSILFGAIDSWIIWKLTKGELHMTEWTCASATALWDPYICDWSSLSPIFFNIPLELYAPLCDTSGHICDIHEDIFGAPIPLTAVVGDTQASVFGQCCFKPGEASCNMGTGCYFTINTGSYTHASISGLYPQVGWKIGGDLTFLCEGYISGIGTSVDWGLNAELFDDVSKTADIARSVEDTAGTYFIPGFNGLSAPYNDPNACAGMIGINRNTCKAHMVRAILEAIAFRFYELYQVAVEETNMPFSPNIKVCGGVSKNDFIMEMISSLTDCTIERSLEPDMSLLGTVYLAGLGAGIWKNKAEVQLLTRETNSFYPDNVLRKKYLASYKKWREAAKRCLHWYVE